MYVCVFEMVGFWEFFLIFDFLFVFIILYCYISTTGMRGREASPDFSGCGRFFFMWLVPCFFRCLLSSVYCLLLSGSNPVLSQKKNYARNAQRDSSRICTSSSDRSRIFRAVLSIPSSTSESISIIYASSSFIRIRFAATAR